MSVWTSSLRRLNSLGHHLHRSRPSAAQAVNSRQSASSSNVEGMRIITIPCLGDSKNYAYLLCDKSGKAAAIDPAEPDKILAAAEKEGVSIDAVLTTHKHWDHAGGNKEIQQRLGGLTIYGGVNDKCEGATVAVKDGDEFDYHSIHVTAIETPFHTMGHICYYCTTPGSEAVVFTGDTLFVGGCGRFFEGTSADASQALDKLKKLPNETKVWCGHNYTASNLKFAQHADPDNADIAEKIEWTKQRDQAGEFTVPSTIGAEKNINPFLRTSESALRQFTGENEAVKVLGALRKAKDNF